MEEFKKKVLAHVEHIKAVGSHCTTEETTKQALILPLLNILDFNPFDPQKVKAEYAKRSDSNTSQITLLLSAEGLTLTPPIVRLGDNWEIKPEDWVYVSANISDESPPENSVPSATSVERRWMV